MLFQQSLILTPIAKKNSEGKLSNQTGGIRLESAKKPSANYNNTKYTSHAVFGHRMLHATPIRQVFTESIHRFLKPVANFSYSVCIHLT